MKVFWQGNYVASAVVLTLVWLAVAVFYPNVLWPLAKQSIQLKAPQLEQQADALVLEQGGQRYRANCEHFAARMGETFCKRYALQDVKQVDAVVVLHKIIGGVEQEVVVQRIAFHEQQAPTTLKTVQLSEQEIGDWQNKLLMPIYGLRALCLLSYILLLRRYWRQRPKSRV